MDTDDGLDVLRKARNNAFKVFRAKPDDETKARFLAAQNAYGAALKKVGAQDDRTWSTPVSGLPEEVDNARLAANAARREVYANPNPETQSALRAAENKYSRIRRKLDPAAQAKVKEANAKKRAKMKLDPALMAKHREAIRKTKAKKKAELAASKN